MVTLFKLVTSVLLLMIIINSKCLTRLCKSYVFQNKTITDLVQYCIIIMAAVNRVFATIS